MERRNFYEILNDTPLNIEAEYARIYELFYDGTDSTEAIVDIVEEVFYMLPMHLKGRTISLEDFNRTYGFNFQRSSGVVNADCLLLLCEYVWNFSMGVLAYSSQIIDLDSRKCIEHLIKLVGACIDDLFHIPLKKGEITIFVPRKSDSIAVSELVEKDVSVSILEYHHYRLRGNLLKKKAILKLLADDIEPQRKELNSINKTLTDNLFQMLQKFVRHNNNDNQYIRGLSQQKLEECYDDIYQMWLLAKLEIDNLERKKRVEETLKQINA